MPADKLLRNDRSARFGAPAPEPPASVPAASTPAPTRPAKTARPASAREDAAPPSASEHTEAAASGLANTNL